MLSDADKKEFTKLIAGDLESGEVDKVTALFSYNTDLYETVGDLVQDERMTVRLGLNMVLEALAEEKPDEALLAIPALLPALKNDSPTFRGDAADLIGIVGHQEDIKYLKPLLAPDEHPQVVGIVREAITNLQEKNKSVPSDLFFLHGMESSPQGIKAVKLKEVYPHIQIPSLPPDIHKRADILENLIKVPAFLIGSSLGGLSAILFSMKHPELVNGMILLAPAVGFFDSTIFSGRDTEIIKSTVIPTDIPSLVIAGQKDDVIPLKDIKAMISRSANSEMIEFHLVDDEHGLNESHDLLLSLVKQRYKGR